MAGRRQREPAIWNSYFSSTTSTRCLTARIMPRTAGVSSSVRVRRILPRPRKVAACTSGLRLALRIWRTVTVFFVSAIARLAYLDRVLARGSLLAFAGAFAALDDVADAAAAALRHHARALLQLQRIEGRAHHVVGIGGAERLGHHVAHAQRFEHRAHRAPGDDAGAGRSRTDQHFAGAVMAAGLVMQGAAVFQRHPDQHALGGLRRLADGLGHFARLAVAEADAARRAK